MTNYGDFQSEIFLQGLAGNPPSHPIAFADLERAAAECMSDTALGYVAGGAGAGGTMRSNREALDRWEIVPRMVRGVTSRDLSTEVCGTTMPAPVLLAPIGAMGIVYPDAEREVAQAAAGLGLPMILSTVSSTAMEDVAPELGDTPGWFQLYWARDQDVAASLVGRAERAGYRAVVVTLDTWSLAWRPRDLQAGFVPFLTGEGLANYFSDPAFRAGLARAPEEDVPSAVLHWLAMFGNPGLSWVDFNWLRQQTSLPILVKGVCHAEDARAAVDAGVDGIVVSNHGGRQVDGALAAIDCLPEVVAAAAGLPVLFDSGIRGGADVVKALALGARAVLLGRPYVYGLALGGGAGVLHVLRCLLAELDLTLALAGHASPAALTPAVLARRSG